ncbi:MAG: tetratricopeptide repeat protein [Rhizomicrobium sp.]
MREAAEFLLGDNADVAEEILQDFMQRHGRTAQALHILAEAKLRLKRVDLAEECIAECVQIAPDYNAARFSYAIILFRLNKAEEAQEQLEKLLRTDPQNPLFRKMRLAVLEWLGDFERGAVCGRELVDDYPDLAEIWMRYGHTLRGLGRHEECVAAYRRAIELSPEHGASYWSLANLKTFRFTDDEFASMQRQLTRTDLTAENRSYLHFALGKAHADASDTQHRSTIMRKAMPSIACPSMTIRQSSARMLPIARNS